MNNILSAVMNQLHNAKLNRAYRKDPMLERMMNLTEEGVPYNHLVSQTNLERKLDAKDFDPYANNRIPEFTQDTFNPNRFVGDANAVNVMGIRGYKKPESTDNLLNFVASSPDPAHFKGIKGAENMKWGDALHAQVNNQLIAQTPSGRYNLDAPLWKPYKQR
jgi:hypothetical protein